MTDNLLTIGSYWTPSPASFRVKVASYLLVYLLAFVTSVKLPKKVFRRSKSTKDRVKPNLASYDL